MINREMGVPYANNKDLEPFAGFCDEINQNFITPEGAQLDKPQTEFDAVFAAARTSKMNENSVKIKAPADSLNSIVVNSARLDSKQDRFAQYG